MAYPSLKQDDILGSREVSFANRQDSNFPQLMRLALDFDLVIVQIQRRAFSHISRRLLHASTVFAITNRDYRTTGVLFSPLCENLQALENFAKENHVDILHDHLFGDIHNNNWR